MHRGPLPVYCSGIIAIYTNLRLVLIPVICYMNKINLRNLKVRIILQTELSVWFTAQYKGGGGVWQSLLLFKGVEGGG